MPKRNDYIVIQEPMISVLGLSGNSLLVFAVIHGFTKDGEQHYRAMPEDLAKWTGASDRTIDAVLKKLRECGYINRRPVVYRQKSTFEYWTNYEELLERVQSGEVLKPYVLYEKRKYAETAHEASMQKLHTSSAETAHEGMQKLHTSSAETAHEPNNNVVKHSFKHEDKYLFHLDAARQTGPIAQEERREFYRIFFEKNAADPAAEAKRFENYYESRGWEATDGRRYDTPAKRRGLAMMWELKSGAGRLTADFGTAAEKEAQIMANTAFLKMCGELYEIACSTGDPDNPLRLVNPTFRCRLAWKDDRQTYDLVWTGQGLPVEWYDRHIEEAQPVVKKYFVKMDSIIFAAS
jgi:Fic family protein